MDAVLGEQARPHEDLDIALPHAQVPRFAPYSAREASPAASRRYMGMQLRLWRTRPDSSLTFTRIRSIGEV